mmetsp:Transcript_25300/g.43569  ORF Transcript_25300/g.43569 Transcript_25300/m.43569 type:complete len:294 (+) Transcript_25300:178-1059(+)
MHLPIVPMFPTFQRIPRLKTVKLQWGQAHRDGAHQTLPAHPLLVEHLDGDASFLDGLQVRRQLESLTPCCFFVVPFDWRFHTLAAVYAEVHVRIGSTNERRRVQGAHLDLANLDQALWRADCVIVRVRRTIVVVFITAQAKYAFLFLVLVRLAVGHTCGGIFPGEISVQAARQSARVMVTTPCGWRGCRLRLQLSLPVSARAAARGSGGGVLRSVALLLAAALHFQPQHAHQIHRGLFVLTGLHRGHHSGAFLHRNVGSLLAPVLDGRTRGQQPFQPVLCLLQTRAVQTRKSK